MIYFLILITGVLIGLIIGLLAYYFLFYRDYHNFFKNETNRVYFEKALIIDEQENAIREKEKVNVNENEEKE